MLVSCCQCLLWYVLKLVRLEVIKNSCVFLCSTSSLLPRCLFFFFFYPFPSLQAKELPTFKDNDFLNEGHKLQIGDDNKKYFLEKLKRDVEVGNTTVFIFIGSNKSNVCYRQRWPMKYPNHPPGGRMQ